MRETIVGETGAGDIVKRVDPKRDAGLLEQSAETGQIAEIAEIDLADRRRQFEQQAKLGVAVSRVEAGLGDEDRAMRRNDFAHPAEIGGIAQAAPDIDLLDHAHVSRAGEHARD
jgi:hypothetical protein